MTVKLKKLTKYINSYLNIYDFSDYGPNGIQVEGKPELNKISFAVSATRDSIEQAARNNSDALIVHHGLIWSFHGAQKITGPYAKRLTPLIKNDINLLGYHLPLDAHLEVGNAATLAKRLQMKDNAPFGDYKGSPTGVCAILEQPEKVEQFKKRLSKVLSHEVILASHDSDKAIQSIGIITGGANSDWKLAKRAGLDAYITGEISEHDWNESQESEVHMMAGGHYATEQFGIQALMSHLQDKFEIECNFISSENPA
ncbi:MAG: Nif3-like dinuclear metal center hexameric protein [Bdellovibrionales bacterium]|nr:Nif3-like dinuclear metal center hexameric protein [Bdellovibrionales bacterium]